MSTVTDVKRDRTRKPPTLGILDKNIPQLLKIQLRWVGFRWTWKSDKWTKVPIDVKSDKSASVSDSGTWSDFTTALKAARAGFVDGIGFVLGETKGSMKFCGLDVDGCRDPETGVYDPKVELYMSRVPTYAEVSITGTGIHLIAQGKLPPGRRSHGSYEMYDTGRYFVVSGHRLEGCPAAPTRCEKQLAELHAELLEGPQHVDRHRQESSLDDVELAKAALAGLSRSRADE